MIFLKWFLAVILTGACVAIAAFLYLDWSLKPVTPTLPSDISGYTLEALAVNITILEIILVLVGFVVTVMGLFGYTGIRTAAIDAAKIEARKVANDQMVKWKNEQDRTDNSQAEDVGDFAIDDNPVAQAVPASEKE